jgi:acetyltransferase-like isoleucine patch superfamily enzyme
MIFLNLKNKLFYHLSKNLRNIFKPRMINFNKNFQGVCLKNIRISSSTFIDHSEFLFLEENIYIGHHNFIEASNKIYIGKGCQITSHITLTTHSSHNSIRLYGSEGSVKDPIGYVKGEIRIGEFTFIGPHCVIAPNTSIGKGCIISAYSYVKGSFPDFSIIRGNPAKVVGDVRNTDNVILKEHPILNKSYMN